MKKLRCFKRNHKNNSNCNNYFGTKNRRKYNIKCKSINLKNKEYKIFLKSFYNNDYRYTFNINRLKRCSFCLDFENNGLLIFCDICSEGFHFYCLGFEKLNVSFTCDYCLGNLILNEREEIIFKELPIDDYNNYKLPNFLPKTEAKYFYEINNIYLLSLKLKYSNDLHYTDDLPKWKNDSKFDLDWNKQKKKM